MTQTGSLLSEDPSHRVLLMWSIAQADAKAKAEAEAIAAATTRTAKAVTVFLLAGQHWRSSLPIVAYREDGTSCFALRRNEEERIRDPLWKRGPKTLHPARVPQSREQFVANGWLLVKPSEEHIPSLLGAGYYEQKLAHAAHELAVAARREGVSAKAALQLEFELRGEPEEPDISLLDFYRDAVLLAFELNIDPHAKDKPSTTAADGAPAKTRKKGNEQNVLAVLALHPEWSDTKIAKAAGVSRTSLYAMRNFRLARQVLRSGGAGRRHGKHDGREAIDDRHPGNSDP